jgi:hypothetical protein
MVKGCDIYGCNEPRRVVLMICWRRTRFFVMACSVLFLLVTAACATKDTDQQQKQREDKTRDEAAKATERAKPEIQEAGRELGRAADEAAREARAFAEGGAARLASGRPSYRERKFRVRDRPDGVTGHFAEYSAKNYPESSLSRPRRLTRQARRVRTAVRQNQRHHHGTITSRCFYRRTLTCLC